MKTKCERAHACVRAYVRACGRGVAVWHGVPARVGGWGVFLFWRPVQYIEESNIYLCFVVYRLKGVLVI